MLCSSHLFRSRTERLTRSLLRSLTALTQTCSVLPLVAALALVGVARFGPRPEAAAAEPVIVELTQDERTIDAVLAKRAPDLGLTLRRQLIKAIAEEARAAGFDPLLILAVIDVESDFEQHAVSNRDARGLMQIQPPTLHFLAQKQGLRLTREEVASDPALQVRLGIRYLRDLHARFGDLDLALMAYNAGPTRIRSLLREKGGLDPFRRYPAMVRRDFRRFREGEGLAGDWALAQRENAPVGDALR
jgi:soluble lytic murein transglycosylase